MKEQKIKATERERINIWMDKNVYHELKCVLTQKKKTISGWVSRVISEALELEKSN